MLEAKGRGYFGYLGEDGERLIVAGWALAEGAALDAFRLVLEPSSGAVSAHELAAKQEPAIQAHFPQLSSTMPASFHAAVPLGDLDRSAFTKVRIEGLVRGEVRVRLKTRYRPRMFEGFDVPPEALRHRVIRNRSAEFFRTDSATTWFAFLEAYEAQAPRDRRAGTELAVLDWGTGCGRLVHHILRDVDGVRLTGCDIDAEAIQHVRAAYPKARFDVIPPHPPLPYAAASFDVVLSYSVLTHLNLDLQRGFAAELHRVMKPGALLLVTTHGPYAASFLDPRALSAERLEREGLIDAGKDDVLDGIAPEGYYRSVYQTPARTRELFAEAGLSLKAYHPQAMSNYQDLYVFARPAAP